MNSALPFRPVFSRTAFIQALNVPPSHGSSGNRSKASRRKAVSSALNSTPGSGFTVTILHHDVTSCTRSRLPRIASQKASALSPMTP